MEAATEFGAISEAIVFLNCFRDLRTFGSGETTAPKPMGLGHDLPKHLCAYVLERVLKLDFLCHGDALFADARGGRHSQSVYGVRSTGRLAVCQIH
jgi:hypothetical protein